MNFRPHLALALLLCVLTRPAAVLAAEPSWIRVDTPNFVVIGTGSEKALTGTGMQFEGFREALSRLLSPNATATAVPTVVIVFPSDKAFEPFLSMYNGKRVQLGGLFVPRGDVNYVLLGPRQSADSLRTVFHEYSHLIVNNIAAGIPVWLNEGLAEYYSSFELSHNGRQVSLGRPIVDHYRTLADGSWLPLRELIDTKHDSPQYNDRSRQSIFYAESWMLMHLLLHGEPDRHNRLSAYTTALASNVDPDVAWDKAFAGDDVFGALRAYAARRVVLSRVYTLSEEIARASGVRAELSPAAAESLFGELLLALNDRDAAALRFRHALALDPTSSRAALGLAEAAEGELTGVAPAVSSDWLADYMIGAALVHGRVHEARVTASSRPLFEHVVSAHPLPNAYAMLAEAAEAADGMSPSVVEGLRQAHTAVPARDDYTIDLARALAMTGAFPEARNTLGTVIGRPHWPGARTQALEVMKWIVEREQWQTARAAHASESSAAAPNAPPPPAPTDGGTPPATDSEPQSYSVYREVKPGEQRAEGMLERVECPSGQPVTVSVRLGDHSTEFHAASIKQIDFITYRTDVAGSVSCGIRPPGDRIYVTWTGDATNGTVVAVEFLPIAKR